MLVPSTSHPTPPPDLQWTHMVGYLMVITLAPATSQATPNFTKEWPVKDSVQAIQGHLYLPVTMLAAFYTTLPTHGSGTSFFSGFQLIFKCLHAFFQTCKMKISWPL